ncbi:MAG: LCP family protein [Mycobacterium sp.]|nr:LCP family protein [Mycobacterium sp.]MBV9722488.1 LCP family protein [Mycobacterium sp.]
MTHRADASGGGQARSPTPSLRHRLHPNRVIVAGAKVLAALVSVVVVIATGIGWIAYRSASAGITTSNALAGQPASIGSDQNILIMGLDSRRDQRGRPLPPDIYDALHAGGEDSGDGTADALIVLHLPAGDASATAISIPRDDYVDLAGCPTADCRGKIKEAYRFAYQQVMDRLGSGNLESTTVSPDGQDSAAKEQRAREAGRKAEIGTVRRLLQIPIDHFIEVTLVGFFQIARVVEPITVCLNEDTSDRYYSGADFHQGIQQITAAQAMAFVRQRRDGDDVLFTDLDRTRRQQAFIASLVSVLHRGGVLSSPTRLRTLLDVAKQNVAVDAGFDLEGFMRDASAFPNKPVMLYTLPVTDFEEIADGEEVNIIDLSTIRSVVHDLVAGSPAAAASTSSNSAAAQAAGEQPALGSIALDVVNASGKQGEAAYLVKSLATAPFIEGAISTADSTRQTSTIAYGPGAQEAAAQLADELDITADASSSVAPNTVRLTVGTDSASFDYLNQSASPTTTATMPVTTVSATGTGTHEPSPTNLTRMSADNIPCVK